MVFVISGKLGYSLGLVAVYAANMLELEVFVTGDWSFRGPFGPPVSWELGVFYLTETRLWF